MNNEEISHVFLIAKIISLTADKEDRKGMNFHLFSFSNL